MVRLFRHYISTAFLILALVEFLVWFVAIYLGVALRFGPHEASLEIFPLWPKALLFAVIMQLAFVSVGLYQSNSRERFEEDLLRIVTGTTLGIVLTTLIFYFLPYFFLGRGAFVIAVGLAVLGIVCTRGVYLKLGSQKLLKRRVLVYGTGRNALYIENKLRRKSDTRNINIIGYVHGGDEAICVKQKDVIYSDESLQQLCQRHNIDEIVVAVEDRRKNFPVNQLLECRLSGIKVLDILTFFERQSGRVMLDLVQPSWLIFSEGIGSQDMRDVMKRAFDIIVAIVLLLMTWPIMLLVAAAIMVESRGHGPVLYRQVRVGKDWRLFQVLKFRSMVVDAESDGVAKWARQNDSRITRVGGFIRKTRLDELPQIFNVLRGEMSFVGPRPERPVFVENLSEKVPYYGERHRVKPGITGWAQILYPYGASEEDAKQKLQYDLYYVKNHSLFIDLMILLQTLEVVLWRRGAR